jgi:hypothetical protein
VCIRFRKFLHQIHVTVGAAGKSSTVLGSTFGAEHGGNDIPDAIFPVSARSRYWKGGTGTKEGTLRTTRSGTRTFLTSAAILENVCQTRDAGNLTFAGDLRIGEETMAVLGSGAKAHGEEEEFRSGPRLPALTVPLNQVQ